MNYYRTYFSDEGKSKIIATYSIPVFKKCEDIKNELEKDYIVNCYSEVKQILTRNCAFQLQKLSKEQD